MLRIDGSLVGGYTLSGSPQFCMAAGDFVWVTRKTTNSVSKLNADSGGVSATVAVGTSPSHLCFDGTFVWVANTDSNSQLDCITGQLIDTSPVGNSPLGLCFDGTAVWVTNKTSNNLLRR